jgi:hypothetical protein
MVRVACEITNMTSLAVLEYVPVCAEVAVTVQLPIELNVITAVTESTVHDVVPAFVT